MNRVTLRFIKNFCASQNIDFPEDINSERGKEELAEIFELFIGYCCTYRYFKSDTLSLDSFSTGGGQDLGIDSLAVILDGKIVESVDEAEEIFNSNSENLKNIPLVYIMTQSKLSGKFKKDEIVNFLTGVQDFIGKDISELDYANQQIKSKLEIRDCILDNFDKVERTPSIHMYYATPGEWVENKERSGPIETGKRNIKNDFLFSSNVEFYPLDEEGIQQMYSDTSKRTYAKFNFSNKITLPDAEGITESYFGNLPLSEYIKIICDYSVQGLMLDERVFEENIRGYQGGNRVNSSMMDTLNDPVQRERFFALNNGVTIVARELKPMGNNFVIQDFYIVNGCQTSNVLYRYVKFAEEHPELAESRGLDKISVPVRIISTNNDSVIDSIVEATNSQTQVSDVDLAARNKFHKSLEQFMESEQNESRQLFYERRSGQFNGISGIEKVRIIDKTKLIRYFGSLFLDQPTNAARFTGRLREQMGENLFNIDHDLSYYQVAAYAGYRLEYFFRKNRNDDQNKLLKKYKPLKWHILMISKYVLKPIRTQDFTSSARAKSYTEKIMCTLENDEKCLEMFENALDKIIDFAEHDSNDFDIDDKDLNKSQKFSDDLRKAVVGF